MGEVIILPVRRIEQAEPPQFPELEVTVKFDPANSALLKSFAAMVATTPQGWVYDAVINAIERFKAEHGDGG